MLIFANAEDKQFIAHGDGGDLAHNTDVIN
jgi:hypothetical protein